MRKLVLLLIPLTLALVACGGNSVSGDPAKTVIDYLQAKVDSNADGIKNLLCASKEGEAKSQAASFASVEAKLDNVQCTFDSASNTVSCTGAIVATYNGENRSIEPGKFAVVQEDGEWRVCGEAE